MANETEQDPDLEEDFDEEEDEDFDPDTIVLEKQETSSDDSEPEEKNGTRKRVKTSSKSQKKQRTGGQEEDAEDIGFENSGDEGIIKDGSKEQRKQRRKRKANNQDEDSGGEGGFVKTRSMRAAADTAVQKKSTAMSGKVTADIDAIWERLKSAHVDPTGTIPQEDTTAAAEPEEADTITIERTYTFAGTIHTETKVVPRSSAQAQAYLATKDSRAGAEADQAVKPPAEKPKRTIGPEGQALSRPKRRKSKWDPNPTGFIKGFPTMPTISRSSGTGTTLKIIEKDHLGDDKELWHRHVPEIVLLAGRMVLQSTQGPASPTSNAKQLKVQKLNVVDKSKVDWAEHVDTIEGAREELEMAKKDKTNYLERRDFLDRVENKAEDDRAKARKAIR